MKKITTLFLLCLAAIAGNAQQKADIEVSYSVYKPNFRDGKTDLKNQYILLANATESKFYSPFTEYIDSLNSTPDGKAKLNEMLRAAMNSGEFENIPKPDGTIYVLKFFNANELKHFDSNGLEKYVYEEPIEQINWEIKDSIKVILGYECTMAITNYHGRSWTVWFAPDIPIQNGPWKLNGLPGLILEAEADKGQYSFVATGIQQSAKTIRPVYLADEYESTTRIRYLKSMRESLDNPLGKINAQFGGELGTISASDVNEMKKFFAPASVADFIETDYHK